MENTDDATITIGSEDQNYWVVAQVTDDDDDGEVTVAFNSYLAGSDAADSDVLTDATGEDDVTVLSQGGQFYTDNQGAAPDQSLLDATEYEMNVSTGLNAIGSDAWQDADDVGSLSYQDRSTDGVAIWTAPEGEDISDKGDVAAGVGTNITEATDIAQDDLAIVQIEASGLEGYYDSVSEEVFLTDDTSQPTRLVIDEATPGANRDADAVDWSSATYDIIPDADNDTYYVAVDTSSSIFEEDEDYDAEFSVLGEEGDAGSENVLNFHEDDEDETVSSQFGIVAHDTELDLNEDDLVLVEAAADQNVTGTTNLAPGSELTLKITSDDTTSPFLTRPEAMVDTDGTLTWTSDFSELSEGTNLSLENSDYSIDEDGQVVAEGSLSEETETATEEPTETATEESTETATEESTETATEEEPDDTETEEPTDDSGPGFTVIAALGALIAAALLAVRRNN
jgi:PGF-CTERM protein